jgi:hypothetical protein
MTLLQRRQLLPLDVIWEVAMHLQSSLRIRDLANLNQTCHAIHQVTLPVLYERLFVDDMKSDPWKKDGRRSKGWKYTK